MKKLIYILLFITVITVNVNAQSLGDYRTIESGAWEVPANWQRYDGAAWVTAIVPPDGTNSNVITIRNGDNINNNSFSVQADQLIVEAGGGLSIAEADLIILDGAGNDLEVYGSLTYAGGGLIVNGNVVIESGAQLNCGTLDVFNGPGSIDILLGGSMLISTAEDFMLGGGLIINNAGTITWGSGSSAIIFQGINTKIESTGIIDFSGTGNIDFTGINNVINNGGSLSFNSSMDINVTGGTNPTINNSVIGIITIGNNSLTTLTADVVFNNHGAVTVQPSAELSLNNSTGIHDGTYTIDGDLNGTAHLELSGPLFTVSGSVGVDSLKFTGSSNQTLTGGGTITNFTMLNSNGITLNSDITVTGAMVYTDGIITSGINNLKLGPNVSIGVNGISWVNGNLEREVVNTGFYSFDIGDATHRNVFDIEMDNLFTPGFITARVDRCRSS
ncbi:MAG: hypothetical protein IPP29_04450 [Bacteroidetes bacterium]|nr:hypothetical protein [Bacteroidota bacterium]